MIMGQMSLAVDQPGMCHEPSCLDWMQGLFQHHAHGWHAGAQFYFMHLSIECPALSQSSATTSFRPCPANAMLDQAVPISGPHMAALNREKNLLPFAGKLEKSHSRMCLCGPFLPLKLVEETHSAVIAKRGQACRSCKTRLLTSEGQPSLLLDRACSSRRQCHLQIPDHASSYSSAHSCTQQAPSFSSLLLPHILTQRDHQLLLNFFINVFQLPFQ